MPRNLQHRDGQISLDWLHHLPRSGTKSVRDLGGGTCGFDLASPHAVCDVGDTSELRADARSAPKTSATPTGKSQCPEKP